MKRFPKSIFTSLFFVLTQFSIGSEYVKPLYQFTLDSAPSSIDFSRDSKRIVVTTLRGDLHLINLENGEDKIIARLGEAWINSPQQAAFVLNDTHVFVKHGDGLDLINLSSGIRRPAISSEVCPKGGESIDRFVVFPDQKRIAYMCRISNRTIGIIDLENDSNITVIESENFLSAVGLSQNGKWLIGADETNRVWIVDTDDTYAKKETRFVPEDHKGKVTEIGSSNDSEVLYIGFVSFYGDSGGVWRYSTETEKFTEPSTVWEDELLWYLETVGKTVFRSGPYGNIVGFSTETLDEQEFVTPENLRAVAVSKDQKWLGAVAWLTNFVGVYPVNLEGQVPKNAVAASLLTNHPRE